jgi:lipid II:glycine glycyltransferase (peptidoglycan interpeptide bridge formation enzyme)
VATTSYKIDPITDARWAAFVEQHPHASIFHTPAWLAALRRTYGYKPMVFTTSAPDQELKNGLAFCRIKSWLTGCRMVSVAFADHCQPLVDSPVNLQRLVRALESDLKRENWKYIELRPVAPCETDLEGQTHLRKSDTYYFHKLDLRPDLDSLFHHFHRSCVQRKIQRAEREGLSYEAGRSESILAKFYRLLVLTRRRHQLPPQPRVWFRNLIDCLADKLTIHVASKGGRPIASILTLKHKQSLVYKYGCSDARFHSLGGMPLLFWKAIQEAKNSGLLEFDLGRSDCDNSGLITFKDRWGAARSTLYYYRYPLRLSGNGAADWKMHIVRHTCARLPDSLLTAAGRLLYRHIG